MEDGECMINEETKIEPLFLVRHEYCANPPGGREGRNPPPPTTNDRHGVV